MAIVTVDYHSVIVSDTYLKLYSQLLTHWGIMYHKIVYVHASCLMLAVTALGNMLIEIQQIILTIYFFLLIIILIIN